jgi:hypothetical protein
MQQKASLSLTHTFELLKPKNFLSFTIQQFCVLPTEFIYVFLWISEQTAIVSLCSINLLVFLPRQRVFTARYGLGLQNQQIRIRPLKVKYLVLPEESVVLKQACG